VVAALAALLVGYVVVTVVFFLRPSLGSVSRPQAVVVLGGYGDRLAQGVAEARAHPGSVLEVSVPGPCPRVAGMAVHCFRPDPQSTQGEARAIAHLASAHHWDRLLVVAGTTQVSRADLRIGRCYHGEMAFADVDPQGIGSWLHFIAYDQAALAKAVAWQWGC